MNLRFAVLFVAVQMFLAAAGRVLANDPGGGTNGIGANVTLTDNGSSVTLANGVVSATINKDSGKITSLVYRGYETVQSGGNIYYSMDGQPIYREMSGCVYSIKTNTTDMVDVSFRQNWTSQAQAFDIEAHWVLRRGDSGFYAYAILDHPAGYPDTTVGEWRMVWKLPGDLLERVYVDELRHWEQPSIADISAAQATSISEIVKLTTGVRAGHYDGKYQYAAEYENIGCWGHASNVRNFGTWIVTGNYEYFNDGPTKQDLTTDWEYQLIHFGRNHFSPSGANSTHGTSGVAWRKIYGPFLLYLNYDPTGGDQCWADAKSQVAAEHGAWPYTWLLGNSEYPLATARGAASGRFLATDALKLSVSTSNAWVGLTDPSTDWQFDSDHYQYWVRAAADGSFSIQNIRPGTYTLHAFTDGEMGEYSLGGVTVTAGTTNALGDLTWNVPRTGNFLLWEIGVPNRTATEFRHGTNDYYEGFIWDTFPTEFPNPLEYTVGVSDWSTGLNYVHNSYKVNGVRNQWKWRINFFMLTVPPSGNATLNIPFASANNAAMDLFVNGESSPFTSFTPPSPPVGGNALQRQGIHAKYYVQQVTIPVSNLHVGTNTITLVMTSTGSDANHFMYDALSLELPSKPPLPAGFDLSWMGGLALNTWDLATTTNWSSNTTARVFNNGNRVLFDDTGLNQPSINLVGTLQPASVTVYAMKSFTFDGSGALAGSMTLAKSGAGTLTVNNTNTFAGTTTISNGTLIVNGALSQSAVTVRSGATLGGIGRLGAGLTMQSASVLAPGNSPGTLTITNTLTEQGGVTNRFDLSDDPTGMTKTNDLIKVFGNLNLSGTNTIVINPLDGLLAVGVYPLIQYTGTFTGGLSNLIVRGVAGRPFALTNATDMIALVVISNRPPTNLFWVGGLNGNTWDQAATSNWWNGTSGDIFAFDDRVTFDNTGSTSPAINLVGDLTVGFVLVNASVNYTWTGSGNITGPGGVTKTNSGTLTILATNDYTGPTVISGGALAVSSLDNGSSPSAIGAASSETNNLVFQSGAALRYLGGNATSDRGVRLNSGGGTFDVTNGTVSLTWNGPLVGNGSLIKAGPGTLILADDNTYAGSTVVNGGTLQMGGGASTGTIGNGNVTNNGVFVFNRSDDMTFQQSIRGNGIVVKKGGGAIVLVSANTYTGGTTNTSGTLVLSNNATLGTGPLVFTGPSGSSVQLADGITITNPWSIPTATVDLMMDCPSGTATWSGSVTAGSGASFRPGTSGSGTLIYSGNASIGALNFIVPRGNVVIAGNGIVSAGGTVCAIGRSGSGTGTKFTAKDNASLTFSSGFMLGHTGSGTAFPIICTIQDNAIISTVVSNFNLHNGASSGATTVLNLNGGTLLTAGFLKSQTGAGQTATINFNGGTVKSTVANASFLNALSGLTANVSTNGAKIDDGGFVISITRSLIHAAVLGAAQDGGLTKTGAGTLTLTATNSYTGPTTISTGTLALTGGAAITNSSSIAVAAGATFDVSGHTGAGITLANGQTLSGFGSVKGNIVVGSSARLAPGASIGTLTFSNSLTLASGCTNIFEISKSPLTNDVARVPGALTNGGTLIVTNISGSLATGDSFKLFNAGSYAGTFSAVALPPLGSGLVWNTSALNTNGTISVVTVASPVFNNVQVLNGNVVFSGSGGTANGQYYVLTATNVALPVANWTQLATNVFDGSGNFSYTNTLDPNTSAQFYRLQVP